METVNAKIVFKDRASRIELLVRIFWTIVASIVLILFSIIASISIFVQLFYILFVGKRNRTLHVWIKTYVVQQFRIRAYASLLTDERPPIVPNVEKA